MSIQRTATALWQRAPIWRGSVVAAGLCTVLAVVASMGGGTSGGTGQPPTYTPQKQGTSAQPGGQPAAPARSGGQSQPGQGPVAMALNPSPENVQRWNAFEIAYGAADAEAREGARCELLTKAFSELEPEDLQLFPNPPERAKQLEAKRCTDRIDNSDDRLAALERAYEIVQADESADKVERLARTYASVEASGFDATRDLSSDQQDALDRGAEAKAQIDASDARIGQLQSAADAATDQGQPATIEDLARAAAAITGFDTARMSDLQRKTLQGGQTARDRIGASDTRLAELVSALSLARVNTDTALRQGLIDSLSALTPLDRERADTEQAQAIEEAHELAAGFASDLLVETADAFDQVSSAPQIFERLRGQKALVDSYGGLSDPTPAQEEAYRTADFAAARLEESNRRLRAMADAAETWRRQPGPAAETAIRSVIDSVTPFDAARMSPEQRSDHETVLNAHKIIDGRGKLTPANKEAVSIYVMAPEDDQYRDAVVERFRRELDAAGYQVVSARERAVVIIELDQSAIDFTRSTFGRITMESAEAKVSLLAKWAFDGSTFLEASASGDASGRSRDDAVDDAIADAVAGLLRDFDQAVQAGGGKG